MKEIKYKEWSIIALSLTLISLLATYLRTLHYKDIITPSIVNLLGNDPWYNMRQIEYIIHTGKYAWFDPMTTFPSGENVFWGPVFTSFCALVCKALGTETRLDIMTVSSFVPVLLMVGVVIGVFIYTYRLYGSLAGILSALFVAIIPGQIYYRSLFGFVDHHIMEVFLGLIFSLLYIISLRKLTRGCEEPLPKKYPLLICNGFFWCLITGITFLLGLLTVTTFTIFGLIVGLNTFFYLLYLHYSKKVTYSSLKALIYTQVMVFTPVIVGLLIMGFQPGFNLSRYTLSQPLVYCLLIGFTLVASYLIWYFKEKSTKWIFGGLVLNSLVLAGIIDILLLNGVLLSSFIDFFGHTSITSTVGECNFWSWEKAFSVFSFGIISALIGVIALSKITLKDNAIEIIYTISWGITMLIITCLHVRYEYFLGVNISIFMGIGIVKLLSLRKEKLGGGKSTFNLKLPIIAIVSLLLVITIPYYLQLDYSITKSVSNTSGSLNEDWLETLDWVEKNTPPPGVGYFELYNENYEYPNESYGIASWWDYGHHLTFLSKRIPLSNPFQHGVAGPTGVAHIFMTPSEKEAKEILDGLRVKYIIIDDKMVGGFFPCIAQWDNKDPFNYMVRYKGKIGVTQNYFDTFMVKLYEDKLTDDFRLIYSSKNQKVRVFEYLQFKV